MRLFPKIFLSLSKLSKYKSTKKLTLIMMSDLFIVGLDVEKKFLIDSKI